MTRVLLFIVLMFFISCNKHIDYLDKADKEINKKIEEKLLVDNINYWELLYKLFNENLEIKGIKTNDLSKAECYKKYLLNIQKVGSFGLIDSSLSIQANELRNKFIELGLIDEQIEHGINIYFIYDLYEPVISKYRKELEKIENIENEAIYNFGTLDPEIYKFSLALTASSYLETINDKQLERPSYEKAFVLIMFGGDLSHFGRKIE